MSKREVTRLINSVIESKSGLEFNILGGDFFISEKSVNLQSNGVVSFFVDSCVNKTLIRMVIDKISGEANCISVRVLNVKPKSKDSRYRRGAVIKKIHGQTVHSMRKKIYAKLNNSQLFVSNLIGGK